VTDTIERYDAKWLGEHRDEIEAIIRCHTRGYWWKDIEVLNDLVSSITSAFVRRRTAERWDPKRGSWRTYLYTAVVRQLDACTRDTYKKRAQHCELDEGYHYPIEAWDEESDVKMDMEKWLRAYEKHLALRGVKDPTRHSGVICMMSIGMTPSEIARKLGVSKQRISLIVCDAKGHWETWHGYKRI